MNWADNLKVGDIVIVRDGNLFPWYYTDKVKAVTVSHILVGHNRYKKKTCHAESNSYIRIMEPKPNLLKQVIEEETIRQARELMSKVVTNMSFETAVKIIKILGEIQNA